MRRLLSFVFLAIAACTTTALAHFPFIVADRGGMTARLIMSESLTPDVSVGIDIVSGAKLWIRSSDGLEQPLALTKVKNYMSLDLPGEGPRVVRGIVDLGVMERGRPHVLIYHPKAILGDPFVPSTTLGTAVPVELIPFSAPGGLRIKLVIDGAPAPGKDVRVLTPDGEEADYKTDADGLTETFTQSGRFGVWARHWLDQPGERGGKKFEQTRHYATLVFDTQPSSTPQITPRTPLPQPLASFGAVASDGWLYVYGGHTAERHEYSSQSVSGRFHRLNLRDAGNWEELAGGVGVQGMNLAAHDGKIYRAGGMQPRNEPGEPADSHSIAEAAVFDPATGRWRNLPPLPTPRSSHDLLALDGKLFAIGGWWMKGKGKASEWLNTMEVLDLSATASEWHSIPQPFARRTLVSTVLGSRIFVIGGFDADDKPQLDVDIYDSADRSWSKGPPIPGKKRNGFAPAACTHDGSAYLSIESGELFRLRADGAAWDPVITTTPRIVHRMVPFNDEILIIGGAAEENMLDLVEAVRFPTSR